MTNIIEQMIAEELVAANKSYPAFASAHEGYAVLLEEVEETECELDDVKKHLDMLWLNIRHDVSGKSNIKSLRMASIKLICEAVQIAAMCDKYQAMEVEYHAKAKT